MFKDYFMKKRVVRDLKYNQASVEGLGLAWYKFNIYFRMFYGVILLWADIMETSRSNPDVFVFTFLWDGICIVLMLMSRQWLSNFRYKGVVLYFVVQYGSAITSVLLLLVGVYLGTIDPQYFMGYMVGSLIIYGIFFALEYKYWKKRAHLFNRANLIEQHYNETEDNTVTFCCKCGEKILVGAQFCKKCGTKVIEETYENEML